MPDGSAFPGSTRPPSLVSESEDQLAKDLACMTDMLPKNPHCYRVMTSALREGLMNRLSDLEDALEAKALTLPVSTLEDAVSLLGILAHNLEREEDFNLTPEQREGYLKQDRAALEAVLPFLATAACMDLAEMGCGDFALARREASLRGMYHKVIVRGDAL